MHPVFCGTEQILTKMLQAFINIRNFDLKRWDDTIIAGYAPLFTAAENELRYMIEYFSAHNFCRFMPQLPSALAWVDASDFAVGGFLVELIAAQDTVPVTADGLIFDSLRAKTWLKSCATLQPEGKNNENFTDVLNLQFKNVKNSFIVHRNLTFDEQAVDSNERELLAAIHLLKSCAMQITGQTLVLYFDNQNAVIITTKGSNKPRLQKYALQIHRICMEFNINIVPAWIPRDLNNFADLLSKTVDYVDYAVTTEFFQKVCTDFGVTPTIDCFAHNLNKKVVQFFSPSYCPGTVGIDAFLQNWSLYGLAWIFPPPGLLLRALLHMKNTRSAGLILVPQWKNSTFYPHFRNYANTVLCKKSVVYDGHGCFLHGADPLSYFGPHFSGNVEVFYFDFKNC